MISRAAAGSPFSRPFFFFFFAIQQHEFEVLLEGCAAILTPHPFCGCDGPAAGAVPLPWPGASPAAAACPAPEGYAAAGQQAHCAICRELPPIARRRMVTLAGAARPVAPYTEEEC